MRSPPAGGCVACWSTSWGSSRARRCRPWSSASSCTIRRWALRPPSPRLAPTCRRSAQRRSAAPVTSPRWDRWWPIIGSSPSSARRAWARPGWRSTWPERQRRATARGSSGSTRSPMAPRSSSSSPRWSARRQRPGALAERLATSTALVVLDNCEHLVAAAAGFVADLLDLAAQVRVLATSQMPLGVDGEVVHELHPLTIDDAVALFTERAARGRAAGGDLVEIVCRQLDGLPLAIELAAARTRSLSMPEIARRLDDRFTLLSDATGRRPPRRGTLPRCHRVELRPAVPRRPAWAVGAVALRRGGTARRRAARHGRPRRPWGRDDRRRHPARRSLAGDRRARRRRERPLPPARQHPRVRHVATRRRRRRAGRRAGARRVDR